MVALHITVRKNKEKQYINTFQKLELMNVRHFCRKEALKPQYSTHQAWPPQEVGLSEWGLFWGHWWIAEQKQKWHWLLFGPDVWQSNWRTSHGCVKKVKNVIFHQRGSWRCCRTKCCQAFKQELNRLSVMIVILLRRKKTRWRLERWRTPSRLWNPRGGSILPCCCLRSRRGSCTPTNRWHHKGRGLQIGQGHPSVLPRI